MEAGRLAGWSGSTATHNSSMHGDLSSSIIRGQVRFIKPRHVLEIGAGYTSIFLLQALKDNMIELQKFQKLQQQDKCGIPLNESYMVPQCVADEVDQRVQPAMLHTVDDLSHPGQTADKVKQIAKQLGSEKHLTLHVEDAWGFAEKLDEEVVLDLIWLDFGAGHRLEEFLERWWPRLNSKGGLLMIHSSLTNAITRKFIAKYQMPEAEEKERLGDYEIFGLLEPHKRYQNSFSIFQKRSDAYLEPIYSMGP